MQRQHTHKPYTHPGRKNKWTLKRISPIDFIGRGINPPVSLISGKKIQTMYEQAQQNTEAHDPEQILATLKATLEFGVVKFNDKKFNVDEYFDTSRDMQEVVGVFNQIIDLTFPTTRALELSNSVLTTIDTIAHRYGKFPVDVLFPTGGYTDLEAYIINLLVCNAGIETRNNIIESAKLQVIGVI